MTVFGRAPLVGAYVCPRGVFVIECQRAGGAYRVERQFESPGTPETPQEAADLLARALRSAALTNADVAIAVRGFGVTHHVLQLPPAKDEMLHPIIEREVRRLEPQLGEAMIGWVGLPTLDATLTGDIPQRSVLTAAVPRETAEAFAQRLRSDGSRLVHLTALPGAMQRLVEEFDVASGAGALVAALPDGAFIGFTLSGAIRLVIEPPLPAESHHEAAALAEEIDLGVMFVRQQFRGTEIEKVTLAGSSSDLEDADAAFHERLHVPVERLGVSGMSAAGFAALGALLDRGAAQPLSIGGSTRELAAQRAEATLNRLAAAAVGLLVLLGVWTAADAVRTMRARDAVTLARHRIQQDSFGLAPIRATAEQRKTVREALGAVRLIADDRRRLQDALAGLAASIRPPVQLDSLRLVRIGAQWRANLGGTVSGVTSTTAVQAIDEMYRELPRRLTLDSLRLDQLMYADSASQNDVGGLVRFEIRFAVPTAKRD